jgi:hypothetical protein
MQYRVPLVSLALIIAVCACARRDPVANDVETANLRLPDNQMTPDPAGGPPETANEAAAAAPLPQQRTPIPATVQGRWALTPEDCSSPAPKARGLLVVSGSDLRFYESRAAPGSDVQTANGSINGTFHFVGEGKAWNKFEALQRNGDKLTRTETNPAASYTYAKC